MKNLRQRRFWDDALLAAVAVLLLLGTLGLCVFPTPRFSAEENRYLADFPFLSASDLLSGRYCADIDKYAAERLPLRRELRAARALCLLAEGNCEIGGVLLCRDGSLARRQSVNQRAFEQNLSAIEKISAKANASNTPITVAIAPRRIDARTEVLPRIYDPSENRAVWQHLCTRLPCAITFSDLTEDDRWYRTDHHWTTEGAYAAYCALSQSLGYTPFARDTFDPQTVSKSFYGTSHSAAGIPFVAPDKIELWRYEDDTSFSLLADRKQTPFGGFYDFDRLATKDGYGVFLGGNYGRLEITANDDRPTLLVIKDSFANAMLPFLARHYNIVAFDPRYTNDDPFKEASRYDAVLLLCGMQTLCESAFLRSFAV